MTTPRRVLQLSAGQPGDCLDGLLPAAEVSQAESWTTAHRLLATQAFDALVADLRVPGVAEELRQGQLAERILARVADGLAVVDFDLRVTWANPVFHHWCGGEAVGRGFYEALGASAAPDLCPFLAAQACRASFDSPSPGSAACRALPPLLVGGNRYLDLHVTLLEEGPAPQFVALCHDTTALVQKQHKLDALHRAGAELAALDPAMLVDLDVQARIELLKGNIRRLIADLLHFETIEIRLLEPATGRLVPLLQDGMDAEASRRPLFAAFTGNGVTGHVAATGRSYLCPDTRTDPIYLPGAPDARSSLTVPLRLADRVVGTFNVESPRPNDFDGEDLQFAEIFSHAVATALNTLELFDAEKRTATSQSIEAVNREVALPVDDILADAAGLLDRYVGHSPEVAERICKILANARQIKQSIAMVGEDLAPPLPSAIREPGVPLRGVRVLVADNDDRVRRSAHQLIGRWGGIVETARDGQEALTMARLAPYDAVVVDIHLPDRSGYEVYHGLRQVRPNARIILMTGFGYDPGHSIVKARQEGLKHVLYKPFRVDQLRDALANLGKEPG